MGFRLVPKSVTLNDLEQFNSPYFALFNLVDRLGGRLRKVEDRHIMFGAEYHLSVISWPKLTHAAVARSLCDS